MIDLATGSLGGYDFGGQADGIIEEFSSAFGAPTFDTGWMPVSPLLPCLGSDDIRGVTWGNVQLQLESANGGQILGGWIVGDGDVIGPDLGADASAGAPSGVTTTEGVGIGSQPADITTVDPFDSGDSALVVPAAVATLIRLDDDGTITGFSAGRNDCFAPSLSAIQCDRPIPVRQLPDGTATTDAMINVRDTDQAVLWRNGDNDEQALMEGDVLQIFEPATADFLRLAEGAPISAQRGSIDVRIVPIADPPVGESRLFVFDTETDCVRQLVVGPGLDVAELRSYAETLAAGLEPMR